MNHSYAISQVADLQDIRQRLVQHSRGIDRTDEAMLASCYHPGATVDYGFFKGPAQEFVPMLIGAQRGGPVTSHRTAQMWIVLNGDNAVSESYVMAYVMAPDADGAQKQRIVCGRYLDRHERQQGEWRLSHRSYVLDTNANWPGEFDAHSADNANLPFPIGGQGASDTGSALLTLMKAKNASNTKGTKTMPDIQNDSARIDAVIARQEIADLTMAYCRGIDRADVGLLKEVFSEDSTVLAGMFNGSGQDFATEICKIVKENFEQTFHSVANQWIEIDGNSAVGETYVYAVSTMVNEDKRKSEMFTGGRYIDRFVRANGAWKIADRSFVADWTFAQPTTRQMTEGMYEPLDTQGKQGPDDPVYAVWN